MYIANDEDDDYYDDHGDGDVEWTKYKYRHTQQRREFVCAIWINDVVQLIVLSWVSIARYIVRDVQMLCMFLRSLWIGAIACVRKHTHAYTYTHKHG